MPHYTTADNQFPLVAIIGGGQLARMMIQSAISLNCRTRVLAASYEEPAARVCSDVIIGDAACEADVRALARGASVVTCEHESLDGQLLGQLQAQGVATYPQARSLQYVQDKLVLREFLRTSSVLNNFRDSVFQPDFAAVNTVAECDHYAQAWENNLVLKVRRGGYDGRGVWIVSGNNHDDVHQVITEAEPDSLLVERRIDWAMELAVNIARSPFGQVAAWPVAQTVQREGQCAFVIAPAPNVSPQVLEQATAFAIALAHEIDVVGMFTVELFLTSDQRLYVNELAMRPHNSAHWTMNGAVTSQFEQHLRAVLDYPLGLTHALAEHTVMANIIGEQVEPQMGMDERMHHMMARFPEAKLHVYGKSEREGRKIGHVNIVGNSSVEDTFRKAELASRWLATAEWSDGWSVH